MTRSRLALIAVTALTLAACGGATQRTGRTVTFSTAGAFPTLTIVGSYSADGCAGDSRAIVENARLFDEHSTTLPGPADLYFYDMREAYAHFQADECTSKQLGDAMVRGLSAAQRSWLLDNVPSDFQQIFRAAETAAA